MLNDRLQILITAEQRRRLESEAHRRGVSIAALIREAIDARYGVVTRTDRLGAVEAIGQLAGGHFLSPSEIEDVVAEERAATAPPAPSAA
jgi:hypothetical protein